MIKKNSIGNMPSNPGVYFFKDAFSKIIYIGKAKNLKKRVFSYFNRNNQDKKSKVMLSKSASVEYLIVDNEVEALITEANMIKEYKPKYNVFLKDDKSFPYIIITNEPFPKVEIIRKKSLKKDGNTYFGPYTDVGYLREVVKVLHQVFQIRTCSYFIDKDSIKNKKVKVCLDYHINKCEGPCEGLVSESRYNAMISNVKYFLKGKNKKIRKELIDQMNQASDTMKFEDASMYRDQLIAIDTFYNRQKKITRKFFNSDVLHVAIKDMYSMGIVMRIRNGLLIGREKFNIKINSDHLFKDVMNNFLLQYYTSTQDFPDEIIIDKAIDQKEYFQSWLSSIKVKAEIISPTRGEKRKIMDLCIKNTEIALKEVFLKKIKRKELIPKTLLELKETLSLPVIPKRIEAFDNSNLEGSNAVAGMVCFINAKPVKKKYRKFNIKTVKGIDDFESMREVVYRRYKRQLKENKTLPDLIVIDGGKGQLSAAKSSLDKLGLGYISIIGIAKKLEEIFIPGNKEAQNIDKASPAIYLIRKIRDEVHRYSVNFHRSKRDKAVFSSIFDDIKGVGPKRIKKIWSIYNSLNEFIKDSNKSIISKTGIPKQIIKNIKIHLK